MKLVLGTNNPGKLTEFQTLLTDVAEVISVYEILGVKTPDPEETGATFKANALIKAKIFAQETGELTVADDSGFEVVALNGEPGVHSKRFVSGSDADRNQAILQMITNTGSTNRTARFVSMLCLFDPVTQKAEYFQGTVEGTIAEQPEGSEGFGYDPIFIPDGYDSSMAALGQAVKNTLSHRAKAIQKLERYLRDLAS